MSEPGADVVIVGGGIAGVGTAYYLARAGVRSVVVETDAVGSHASGFAYGGLSPLSGFGIPGPLAEMAQEGIRAHRELAVTGHTELPHQDHVERGGQPPRDLGAHRHATARQCEHDWSIERDLLQLVGELLPGVYAVPEHHR